MNDLSVDMTGCAGPFSVIFRARPEKKPYRYRQTGNKACANQPAFHIRMDKFDCDSHKANHVDVATSSMMWMEQAVDF